MHYAGIHLSLSLVTTKIDDVSFIFIIIEIFFSIYAFNGRTGKQAGRVFSPDCNLALQTIKSVLAFADRYAFYGMFNDIRILTSPPEPCR